MLSRNVLWLATKGTWNSDMYRIQIQIKSAKQDQIVKDDFIIDQMKYAVNGNHWWERFNLWLLCSFAWINSTFRHARPVLYHSMTSLCKIEEPMQVCIWIETCSIPQKKQKRSCLQSLLFVPSNQFGKSLKKRRKKSQWIQFRFVFFCSWYNFYSYEWLSPWLSWLCLSLWFGDRGMELRLCS